MLLPLLCCCLPAACLLRLRPEMVVGWYHSHPGFGCWLSGVDINTQQVSGLHSCTQQQLAALMALLGGTGPPWCSTAQPHSNTLLKSSSIRSAMQH